MADRKPDIIRYVGFTVDHGAVNDYGDLMVTSKSGKEYKIGNKRANLFDIFQPDTEVVVGYASYMNKDYIAVAHTADQFPANITVEKEKLAQQKPIPIPPPAVEKTAQTVKDTAKPEPRKVTTITPKDTREENIERIVWWKELGEAIRSKDIDATKPAGKLMRAFYYAEMVKVLNIKIEEEDNK